MRSVGRPSSLALALLLLAAACRGDPATAPPAASGGPPGAEAAPAPAAGPVAVTEVLDLGAPAEGGPYFGLEAVAVNERGQVAVTGGTTTGRVPLLWEAGAFRPLAPVGSGRGFAFIRALTGAGVGAGAVSVPGGAVPPAGPAPEGRSQAALFAGGTPVLLPDGPGDVASSGAGGANEAGDAVGTRLLRLPGVPFPVERATLWRRGTGEVVDLGALTATAASGATAVNSRGQAVGVSSATGPGFNAPRPVFFADGRVIALEVPPGYTGGTAFAVNERGQAAGQLFGAGPGRAAFWDQDGRVTLLEEPPGAGFSTARGINDAGDVVGAVAAVGGGRGTPPPAQHAALWRGGALTVLPAPPHPPGTVPRAQAADVNNRGQVVGQSTGAGDAPRAVRWTVSPAAPVPDDPPGPNRAPAVVDLRPDPATGPYRLAADACGGRFTVCVRFTVTDADGDADAPFRVVVDWGDGTPWAPNELTRSGVPALAPHRYAAPGTYTLRVTATDRRGAASTATLTLTVVP